VDDLSRLPVKAGFRLRGLEMTRIETFTDAAFAFALTLLVLSTTAPRTLPELQTMLRDIPTFLFGAAILMIFWSGHNEWSRRFGLDDKPTMILSVALVCTILIYVYPLRYVGGLFVTWLGIMTHLPIGDPTPSLRDVTDINAAFVIYGAGFVANGIVIILLNLHAYRLRAALRLNETELMLIQSEIGAWVILCSVGAISVLVGALFPRNPGIPGMTYMLLPILMPLYGVRMSRRHARLKAADPSHKEVLKALGADEVR
jgi:uncharacterized membrane protein